MYIFRNIPGNIIITHKTISNQKIPGDKSNLITQNNISNSNYESEKIPDFNKNFHRENCIFSHRKHTFKNLIN